MKKVKEFILSVILPRRMYKYHNMKIVYTLCLFILSIFVLLFSVNLTAEKFMKEQILEYPDFDAYECIEKGDFPEYRIAKASNGTYFLDCIEAGEGNKTDTLTSVTTVTLENKNKELDDKVIVTVVFDESLDVLGETNVAPTRVAIDKNVFDLNSYLNQDIEEGRTNILFVFTKKTYYYFYNFGKYKNSDGKYIDNSNIRTDAYQLNSDGSYKYFLPSEDTEIVFNEYGQYDTSNWKVETKEGNTVTRTINGKEEVISAQRKRNENIRYALSNGEYSYGSVDVDRINSSVDAVNLGKTDIITFMRGNVELMAEADANWQKSLYSFFVVLLNVVFPLVFVLITWLLSRSFVMSKFREYYAICSICYMVASVIGFILGFFITFDKLIMIILVIELLFYIVAAFRINTDPKLLDNKKDEDKDNDDNSSSDSQKREKPQVNFKKIKSSDVYSIE